MKPKPRYFIPADPYAGLNDGQLMLAFQLDMAAKKIFINGMDLRNVNTILQMLAVTQEQVNAAPRMNKR
jgi:hypothetical protein